MAGKKRPGLKRIIALCAAAAVVAGGLAYGNSTAKKRSREAATQGLVTEQVKRGDVSRTVVGTGSITAGDPSYVQIPVGVEIDKIYVEQGDSVEKGDKIAKVSEMSVKERLLDVEEAIDQGEEDIDKLDKKDEDYQLRKEIAQTEVGRLKKARESLKKLKEDQTVRADSGGVVSVVNIAEGEEVSAVSGTSGSSDTAGFDSSSLKAFLNMGGSAGSAGSSDSDDSDGGTGSLTLPAGTDSLAGNEPVVYVSGGQLTGSAQPQSQEETAASEEEQSRKTQKAPQAQKAPESQKADETQKAEEAQKAEETQKAAETKTDRQEETSQTGQTGEKPAKVEFDSINISIEEPKAGASPQKEVSLPADLHAKAQILWLPQTDKFSDGQPYTALVTIKADQGHYLAGRDGKVTVKVDSCPQAVSTSYDTDRDGYIDTAVAACPYVPGGSGLSKQEQEYLNGLAQKQALEVLGQLSKNYPKLEKQIEKELEKASKKLAKSAKKLTKSLSGNALSGLMGSLPSASGADLSSLLGSQDAGALSGLAQADTSGQVKEADAVGIVPVKNACLKINVDELDINELKKGQSVSISLDAIEGQKFDGKITKVSQLSSGESGKYPVSIKLKKAKEMKFGMSATATIYIEKKENVLTIPVEAIQTLDGSDVVYTGSEPDGTLTGPVKVTTGLSDGKTAEVTDGLKEGQDICYFKAQKDYSMFNEMQAETGSTTR